MTIKIVYTYLNARCVFVYKSAAIQMCSSPNVEDNLRNAANLMAEAARNNAKLVVLPEMFAVFGDAKDKVSVKENFGDGKIQNFLSEQARANSVWIVGGTIPIACDNPNKVKAASLLFDAHGNFVTRYDKIHLFDAYLSETEVYRESDTTEPGDYINVVDTPFGKLGIAVCFDLRFPELFRSLYTSGVEIITIPTAFTVKTGAAHWEILLRNRAIENFSYVIGACQGGVHSPKRMTYGNSMIIGPWGEILAHNKEPNPGIIYAEIDKKKILEARNAIPVDMTKSDYKSEIAIPTSKSRLA